MYCRNCGNEVNEKAEICVNCGVRPLAGRNFCQECGVETKPNQEVCIKCGVRLKTLISITEDRTPLKIDFSGLSQYYQDEFKKIYESGESYKGKWNWAAFFFGAIWALTKGVWLAPVICIVASFIHSIVGIIYWFIFGARGNYMYYCAYVKKKQLPI
jgi:RNA polymerase subunit RPABC4/transcription elongation factor Spt4